MTNYLLSAILLFVILTWRCLLAFTDSITKLQTDVAKLIAENGPAAVQTAVAAAVAAKDTADAAAVDAVDATVVASLTPPVA